MRLVFLKKTAWALFAGAAACAFAGAQTQPPAQQQKPQTNQSESEQKAKRIEQARVWETYIQAAGQSIIADDQVSAEIFLNAAMDLARPMGPRNLRLFVTGKMLGLVYQDQGNDDAWEKVHGETPEISRPNFGKEFLPVATILDRVVDVRYDVWKEQSAQKDAKANRTIETTGGYELLALQIREAAMDKSDRMLAATASFRALIVTKGDRSMDFVDEVEALYQMAMKGYAIKEKAENDRLGNSEQFSILGTTEKAAPRDADDLLVMKILLARRYVAVGDSYKEKGETAKAKEKYAQGQELYEEVVHTMQTEWLEHPNTTYQEYSLADTLQKESLLESGEHNPEKGRAYREEAIERMRAVVKYYDKHSDVFAALLRDSAGDLASYLEQDGKKSEADAIRAKYKLRK